MKRFLAMVGLGVAVCAAGLWAWRSGADEPSVPSVAPAPVPVVAAKVEVSDFPIAMSGIGTVEAYNTVDIPAQVTGTIERIGFVEGQTVHPGSLIAQLDPRPFQAALEEAQANLKRDQAQLTNAQVNLNRFNPLLKHGYVTEIITDDALEWLQHGRDQAKPFVLMVQHKAPHRVSRRNAVVSHFFTETQFLGRAARGGNQTTACEFISSFTQFIVRIYC